MKNWLKLRPAAAAWLSVHPSRTLEWLKERLADGFHIHHLDGNHYNNTPRNTILVDEDDHRYLHGMKRAKTIKGVERKMRRRRMSHLRG